jgi:type VI protein secretion system component VasK
MSGTWARLRALLGITHINERLEHLHEHARRQENTMATVIEALEALTAQQAETSAAQSTSFANLQAAVERLESAVANGEVSPEIQAAVDQLSAGFTAMKEQADAADDGTEPTPPAEPEQV